MSLSLRKRISLIFGTRPEAIKLCPLILKLRDHETLRPHVCVTGQHQQMLDQVMDFFGIQPDVDLALMQPGQMLGGLTSRAIAAIDSYIEQHTPDMVLVQGDTTTVFCAALTAFYHRIPVGHVEAGLRTWDKYSPYPEEMNRALTTKLTDLHFAPTEWAKSNLLREGVPLEKVFVTGNTVIDALQMAIAKTRENPPEIPGLPQELMNSQAHRPMVLITGHRRESFGAGFESICAAIATLAERFPEVVLVYPVHLNPNVREPVFRLLGQRPNIYLIEPLSYVAFVALMDRAKLILTDSGGVQEEAPSLGKPVLVMRDTTERQEAIDAGTAKLVGTDRRAIVEMTSQLLNDGASQAPMSQAANPYGDGRAADRIVRILSDSLLLTE